MKTILMATGLILISLFLYYIVSLTMIILDFFAGSVAHGLLNYINNI